MIYTLSFILLGALVLFGLVWYLSKRTATIDQAWFEREWDKISTKYNKGEDLWPQAIIDADKLVDEALKQLKYPGKTMGERLVSANRVFRDADGIWRAHKLRNKLVHEHGGKLKKNYVSSALRSFRKALKDLGAM